VPPSPAFRSVRDPTRSFPDPDLPEGPLLRLFGGALLEVDGRIHEFSPFQGVVLGLVASGGRGGASRSTLIDMLWPREADAAARARLRQLIYSLNRRTVPALLETEGPMVILNSRCCSTDLAAIQAWMAEGRFMDAVGLASGEFLGRTLLSDNEGYEDWRQVTQRRIRGSLVARLRGSLTTSVATGDWSVAAHAAEALMALEPAEAYGMSRTIHRFLDAGQVREAARLYRTLVAAVGLRGSSQHILDGEVQDLMLRFGSDLTNSTDPSADGEGPFVGRGESLGVLVDVLGRRVSRSVGVVVVTGEAGSGKSRLLMEAMAADPGREALVLTGRSSQFEHDVPLNTVTELIQHPLVTQVARSLPAPWRNVLESILPDHQLDPDERSDLPAIPRAAATRRMMEAVLRCLQEVAVKRPLALLVDDIQWADETSVAVLDFVRRGWVGGGLSLVFAMRSESLAGSSRAAELCRLLVRSRRTLVVDLDELPLMAATELAQHFLHRDVDSSVAPALARIGGGNPLHVIELALEYSLGNVRLPVLPSDVPLLPSSVTSVIERRLALLDPLTEEVGWAVACHNSAVPEELVYRVASGDRAVVGRALNELREARLTASSIQGVDVRHDLIRVAMYNRMGPVHTAMLHGRWAEELQAEGRVGPGVLALHCERAGDRAGAHRLSLEAAQIAIEGGALLEALGFLRMGWRSAEDPVTKSRLMGEIGALCRHLGDYPGAVDALAEAVDGLRRAGQESAARGLEVVLLDTSSQLDGASPGDALRGLAEARDWALDRGDSRLAARALDAALHVADRAEAQHVSREVLRTAESLLLATEDSEAEAHLAGVLAMHVFYGDSETAVAMAERAVAAARRSGSDPLLLDALNRQIVVLIQMGRLDSTEGLRAREEAEVLAERSGDPSIRCKLSVNQGVWQMDRGDPDGSLPHFRRARELLRGGEESMAWAALCCNYGEAYLRLNQVDVAKAWFEKGLSALTEGHAGYLHPLMLSGFGSCLLWEGDLPGARKALSRLPEPPEWWGFDPTLIVGFRAAMLARRGKGTEAGQHLDEVAAQLQHRLPVAWLKIQAEYARVLGRSRPACVRERARRAAERAADLHLDRWQEWFERYL